MRILIIPAMLLVGCAGSAEIPDNLPPPPPPYSSQVTAPAPAGEAPEASTAGGFGESAFDTAEVPLETTEAAPETEADETEDGVAPVDPNAPKPTGDKPKKAPASPE